MTKSMPTRISVVAVLALAGFAACSTQGFGASPASTSGSATASATPGPSSTPNATAVSGTPASSPPASALVGGTPVPSHRPSARPSGSPVATDLVTITRDDAGSTVNLVVGQRVLVKLGVDLLWTVTISDPQVLERAPGVTLVIGAQGLYEARKSGRATISAVGDPPCRNSTPPCMAPSLLISVTVVVK